MSPEAHVELKKVEGQEKRRGRPPGAVSLARKVMPTLADLASGTSPEARKRAAVMLSVWQGMGIVGG